MALDQQPGAELASESPQLEGDDAILARLEKFAEGSGVQDDEQPEDLEGQEQVDPEAQAQEPEKGEGEDKAALEIDPEAAVFEIQVGEESKKLSLKDLQAGYLEAEQVKAQVAQVTQERDGAYAKALEEFRPIADSYAQNLQIIEKAVFRLAQGEFGNVDLSTLARENPAEYVAYKQKVEEWQLAIQAAREETQRARQELDKREEQERARLVQESVKVLQKDIPSWSPTVYQELMKFAVDHGLPVEQVQKEIHPGAWKLVWKAQQWDKLQKAKPEITKKVVLAPKVMKNTPKDQDGQVPADVKKLRQQFKKSGSLRDAAKFMERIL